MTMANFGVLLVFLTLLNPLHLALKAL